MTLCIRPALSTTPRLSRSFHTASAKPTIAIGGTGLTSLWTAYSLTKKLQEKKVQIIIAGKWDWEEALKRTSPQHPNTFSHEASGVGPVGIHSQSGLLSNGDNLDISPDLEAEGRRFLDLYTGWHERHLGQERQRALTAINGYARGLWGEFQKEARAPLSLHLKGGWRLYDQPEHFEIARRQFGVEVVSDSDALAQRLPFYKKIILQNQMQGIFFPDDGLVDSNRVRKFLWSRLQTHPAVEMNLDADVRALDVNSQGVCQGFVLQSGKKIKADVTILAMGLTNKHLLARHHVALPLWNIWSAALTAQIKDRAKTPSPESVSFHTQQCITGAPDGKTITIAGTRMMLPESAVLESEHYWKKLSYRMAGLYGNRIRFKAVQESTAASAATPDDLPIVGLQIPQIDRAIVINPTAHLGLTQSPALGNLAASHALQMLSLAHSDETAPSPNLSAYRIDRFQKDIELVNRKPVKPMPISFPLRPPVVSSLTSSVDRVASW